MGYNIIIDNFDLIYLEKSKTEKLMGQNKKSLSLGLVTYFIT